MSIVLVVGIGVAWVTLCALVIGMCWSAKEGDEPPRDARGAVADAGLGAAVGPVAVAPLAPR